MPAFKPPELTLPEWAVVSQCVHLIVGELLAGAGQVTRAEVDVAWDQLHRLLELEFGQSGPDSDGMLGLRVVFETVWEAAIPRLKSARSRHWRQFEMFQPDP